MSTRTISTIAQYALDDDFQIEGFGVVLPHNTPVVDVCVDDNACVRSLNPHFGVDPTVVLPHVLPEDSTMWKAAHKLRKFVEQQCFIAKDDVAPLEDIILDVLNNPKREISRFVTSLYAMADNVDGLFLKSKNLLIDPDSGEAETPLFILSKTVISKLIHGANLSKHKIASLVAAALSAPLALTGCLPAMCSFAASVFAFTTSPGRPQPFATKTAALMNLKRMFTTRQFVRFIFFSSIIALAWKAGGAVWRCVARLFHTPTTQLHSLRLEGWVSLVTAVLVTWVTGVFSPRIVTEFLRASSFSGANAPIMKTLNEAATAVMKLLADFLSWIGLQAVSSSLLGWTERTSYEEFTRRGGQYNELVPRLNSFLSARSMGASGPGTIAYVEEGRCLVRQLDSLLKDALVVDGAGVLIASMQRVRQQVVAAVENSLFSVEMSVERIEPVSVLFCGGPRLGKTMLMNVVIEALRQRCVLISEDQGIDRQVPHLAREGRWLYSRNTSDEFFSGYNRQCVILYDDLFTGNNAKQSDLAAQKHERELSEIQALVSSQPFAPPMPEVGAGVPCPKGTYISPAWVCATSNFLFPNTGSRATEIIDDRIQIVVLAVLRGGDRRKDANFSHLRLFVNKERLSLIREALQKFGVQEPYSTTKQMPYTEEEFEKWSLRAHFKEVSIQDLLDLMVEGHQKRVCELVVRRMAVSQLVQKDEKINHLADSLRSWCGVNGLICPNEVEVMLRGLGVRRTIEEITAAGHKLQVVDPTEAELVLSLQSGKFVDGEVGAQVLCDCVGGHQAIVECPRFDTLVATYYLARREDTSPQRTLNYQIVDGNLKVLRPATSNAVQKFCDDVLGSHDVLGRPLENRVNIADDFVGIAGYSRAAAKKIESVAVCQPNGRCLTIGENGGLRPVARKLCHYLEELHTLTIDHDRLTHTVFDMPMRAPHGDDRADRVVIQLGALLDNDGIVSDALFDEFVFVLSTGLRVSTTIYPSVSSQLATILPPNIVDLANHPPRGDWIRRVTERIQFSPSLASTRVLDALVTRYFWYIEQLSKVTETYDKFELVVVSYLLFQSQMDWRVSPSFSWIFVADDGAVSLLPHIDYPYVIVQHAGQQHGVFRHDLRNGPIMMDKFVAAIRGLSWEEVSDEVPVLLRFLNRCTTKIGVLDRLKCAVNWVFDKVCSNWKVVAAVLLGVSGALIAFDIAMVVRQMFGSVQETHSASFHRPRAKLNPFGRVFDRLFSAVVHDGASYKCKLCQSLTNIEKVSNWDESKQLAVVRMYAQDKCFLKGMYEANCDFLEALQQPDLESCVEKLEHMVDRKKVPHTGGGMSRHLYVALSYACVPVRRKAISCLKAQQAEIVKMLGKKFDTTPAKTVPLRVFQTCNLKTDRLNYCTFDGKCSCQEPNARYLPTGEFEVTGVERCVAQVASTIGTIMIGDRVVGRGMAVADGVIVAPTHVFDEMSDQAKVEWSGLTRWSEICSRANLTVMAGTDLAVLACHSTELPCRRLDEVLMREEPKVGSKVSIVMRGVSGGFVRHDRTIVGRPTSFAGFDPKYLYEIDEPLQHGDSGAVVVQGSHIVGHYSGSLGDHGIITKWPRGVLKVVAGASASSHINSSSVLSVDLHGFLVTDEYDTHVFDSSPSTELRHSDLYGPLEACGIQSVKRPASQSFEALLKSFSKWEFCENRYDRDYEEMAAEYADLVSTAIEMDVGKIAPFTTWDATLNGHEVGESPVLKRVEMSTSAGAPFCDLGVAKKDLIDDSKEWLECKPNFLEILDQVERRFLSGDVAGYPATANNKDELRDHQRVDQKKTRLFCATPIHHNMLMRKYVGRWLGAYKRLGVARSMQAMGMDVFGGDWDILYRYLTTPGGIDARASNLRCLAGDFSRFDTSHTNHRLRGAMSVVAAAFENKDQVLALGKSIEQFLVRFNGREVRVPAGLPSGCQLTTPLNCVLNILLWLTCWKKITGTGLQEFMANVRLVVYGDDVVLTMSKSNPYFTLFSPHRVVQIMADLGYTLEGDDGGELAWKKIDEVTFLKRRFVPDPHRVGKVHAPRPLDEVWTQLMWTRSSMSMDERIAALQCFASEIGQYDPIVQQSVWNVLCEATRRANKDQRIALERSNFKSIVRRAWEKEGTLGDLVRLRHLFWKLW